MRDDMLPAELQDIDDVEEVMTRPSSVLRDELQRIPGDILVLGVGGKMGPTLARLAKRAVPAKRVIGVARFSEAGTRDALARHDVETIACDLLDRGALAALPDVENVIFMAGRKFGSSGNVPLTWAMNVHVPAMVAERYRRSRIVAFSTGCVYPFVAVDGGGANEDVPPIPPPGDYATSCVGRERMFEYFSALHGTPGRLIRLNYAIDMRYGVLHDVAAKVLAGTVIDLSMGHVNVIWQGDANTIALRALARCTTPTSPLNVTGPETISVRWLAGEFARLFNTTPRFSGQEAPTGWLNDARRMVAEFGPPSVPLATMIDWTASWLRRGGRSLGKPTHYDVRDGQY